MSGAAAVEVKDLVLRYGPEVTAVDGTTWTGRLGQVTAVLGPNGAGKTSTIETLEGYRTPTAGRVAVLGLDPQRDARALAPRIGVMLQRNGVYLTMRPRETVRLFASYYGVRALAPDALLERVGLGAVANTPWRRLSGGEQQRLSLALALVGRPEVVFLDEPTAMVDPAARNTVRTIIRELRDDGVAVVMTTHDLDDAERLADRVVIIDHGKVVADATPNELTAGADADGVAFDTRQGVDLPRLSQDLGADVVRNGDHTYRVNLAPDASAISRVASALAAQNVTADALRAGRHRLEDVFLRLTGPAGNADTDADTDAEGAPRSRRRRRAR